MEKQEITQAENGCEKKLQIPATRERTTSELQNFIGRRFDALHRGTLEVPWAPDNEQQIALGFGPVKSELPQLLSVRPQHLVCDHNETNFLAENPSSFQGAIPESIPP